MKSIFTRLLALFAFIYQVNAQDPQFKSALNFDGVNDHVVVPKAISDDFTLELWIQTAQNGTTGANWYNGTGILDAAGASQNEFGISLSGSKITFGAGGQNSTITSKTSINDGTWNHVAVSRTKSSGLIKLYINGILEDSLVTTNTSSLNVNPSIFIGKNQSEKFFKGNLDEVRIWSTVRTRNQIQNNKNTTLTGSESGLNGYYKFDNANLTTLAIPYGDNRSGECSGQYFNQVKTFNSPENYLNNTTAINYSWSGAPFSGINSDNFTVQWNGEIKASYSERYTFYTNVDDGVRLWVDDRLVIDKWTDVTTATEYSDTITLIGGQNYSIRMQFYEHLNSATAQLSWSSASLTKEIVPFTVPVLKDETVNARHGVYNYFTKAGKESNFIPAFSPYPYPLNFPVAKTDFGNALDFDGLNDLIVMPYAALNNANFDNGFTMEFWIQNSIQDQAVFNMSIASGAYNELYTSYYRTAANNQNTSDYFIYNKKAIDASWHHIALTVDVASGIGKFYVDGIVSGTVNKLDCRSNNECWTSANRYLHPNFLGPDALWGLRPSQDGAIRIFKLGQGINPSAYFKGKIDELRIWNYARTGQQINEHKFIPAVGNEQGLIQYFNFDQGTPNGNNTGIISFPDLVSGEQGEIVGFNLNGNTSNWVKSDINSNNPEAPEITHIDTESAIPGKTISISGVNIISGTANYKVTFGSIEAQILQVSDNVIKVIVPNGVPGLNKVRVSSSLGASKPLDFTIISTLSQLPFSWSKRTIYSQNKPKDNLVKGDINQDGFEDFIMSGNPTLVYFQNNGSGDFQNARILDSNHAFKNLSLIDLDSDKDLDLVYSEDNKIVWMENLMGTWTKHQIYTYTSIKIASIPTDYDKDGDNDLLIYGDDYLGLRIFENNGHGNFAFIKFIGSNKRFFDFGNSTVNRTIVSKDFNNDGYADIAANYAQVDLGGDSTLVLINNKQKGFNTHLVYVYTTGNALTTTDINNDQFPELIDVGFSATFGAYLNSGTSPYFSGRTSIYLLNGLNVYYGLSAEPADMDGDGFTDILAANTIPGKTRSISWLQNNLGQSGSSSNIPFTNLFISDIPLDVIYGIPTDIDNDGDLDVITVSTTDNRTMAFYHVYSVKNFETFSIPEQISAATINNSSFTIDVTVPSGTVLKRIIPQFTLSPKASAKVGIVSQISGVSPNDFQDIPVTYSIMAEDSTTQNWIVRIHPLPASPTSLTVTNATATGATISWSNDSYATSTLIDVSTDINFTSVLSSYNALEVTGSTINLINLNSGQIYYVRLRGKSTYGLSASYSQTLSFITRPAAPTSISLTNLTETTALFTWSATTGASSYEVDVSTSADGSFTIPFAPYTSFSVSTNNINLLGMNTGVLYYFRVRAINASGASVNSSSVSFTTYTTAPTAISGTLVTENSFTANWNPVNGATSYKVDLGSSDFSQILISGQIVTGTTSFSFTNLTPGTTYAYRTSAVNNTGLISGFSNTVLVTTLANFPIITSISAINQTSANVAWTPVTGATSYQVDVSFANLNFQSFIQPYQNFVVNTTNLSLVGLLDGTDYLIRVRSVNASGNSAYSASAPFTTVTLNPVATAATLVTGTSFTANWNAVSGATNYIVELGNSDFSQSIQSTTVSGTTSYTFNNLTPGTIYSYRISAVNKTALISGYSNTINTTTLSTLPVISGVTPISTTSANVSWTAVTGATSYQIDVSTSTDGSFTIPVAPYTAFSVTTTNLTLVGLTPGTDYQVRVRGVNSSGISANSPATSFTTITLNPVATTASAVGANNFTANWDVVSGALSYRIELGNSDFTQIIQSGILVVGNTNNTYTFNNLNPGITYAYRLTAVNNTGLTSGYSNIISIITLPDLPVITGINAINQNSANVSWTTVNNATGYLIDVSTRADFLTFVPPFNNFKVILNNGSLFGLTDGTTYYVRISAINSSGPSATSATTTFTTVTLNPVANQPTLITTSSFTANWTAVNGAVKYKIELGNTDFSQVILPGVEVTGVTSYTFNQLLTGIGYAYRVMAVNAGGLVSGNSNIIATSTLPQTPILNPVTGITQNSASLSWQLITGATNYQVDLSEDNFSTFITPYNNYRLTSNNITFNSLRPGRHYYLRVRSANASGDSPNFSFTEFITIPPEPIAIAADQNSSNGFTANWVLAAAAENYRVEISENNFITILQSITTNENYYRFQNLELGNTYAYRVVAINSSGSSGYSNIIVVVPTYAISISSETFNANNSSAGLTATSPNGIDSVTLSYRGIYSGEYQKLSVPRTSGNSYEITITPEMQDSMGTEYFFSILDKLGDRRNGELSYYYSEILENNKQNISFKKFGKDVEKYTLFSIPYELDDQNIESIFNPVLGKYDNTRWRLMRYEDGRNLEYGSGLNKIQVGKGYWFISAAPVNIPVFNAEVTEANRKLPYAMNLKKGWNQIGNPFPINLSWSSILHYNPEVKNISDLYLFESGNFKKGDLEVWGGGFVNVEEDVKINIPVNFETTISGRNMENKITNSDISKEEWFLPLTLTQSNLTNNLSGLGMHPLASENRDPYDESCLPRLEEFIELGTLHPEYFQQHFMRDVVPNAESKTWNFTIRGSSQGQPSSLKWNSVSLGDNEAVLFLFDPIEHRLIDMKKSDSYDFNLTEERVLKFFYAKQLSSLSPDANVAALPYPNPFTNLTHIPVMIAEASQRVSCIIFDLTGKIVTQLNTQHLKTGYNELEWNGTDHSGLRVGTGVYYYKINIGNSDFDFGRFILK